MKSTTRFWLLLIAALVLVVVLIGGASSDGPALDPRSTNPDGARGIVEVLERLGARVDRDAAVPHDDATAALMLQDRLSAADRELVDNWILGGGVLVVADLSSTFAQRRADFASGPLFQGRCTISALTGAERLDVTGSSVRSAGLPSCFGDGDTALIVAEDRGDGTVVTVGSTALFTNEHLDEFDAAVVAVSLLAPTGADAHVAFVGPSLVDFGEGDLADLIAPRVSNAIWQLLAAFLLYAIYRSRRLGNVVVEPLPVHIEGSELVLQSGRLSERADDPASAAAILRSDFDTRYRRALSVPTTEDAQAFAHRIASLTDRDPSAVVTTLMDPVTFEEDLVRISRQLSALEESLSL